MLRFDVFLNILIDWLIDWYIFSMKIEIKLVSSDYTELIMFIESQGRFYAVSIHSQTTPFISCDIFVWQWI